MSELLWSALCLMLVLEGVLPFLSPKGWRDMFTKATQLSDAQIRWLGLSSMLLGLMLLFWVRN